MYTKNNKLRDKDYEYLSAWFDKMQAIESIDETFQEIKAQIYDSNYKHILMKSWKTWW